MTESLRVYDGSLFCHKCEHCPVVDYVAQEQVVVIHDPHKPESGSFKMTVEEYNALIAHSRLIT